MKHLILSKSIRLAITFILVLAFLPLTSARAGSSVDFAFQSGSPKAPTNMKAVAASSTSAYLTWTNNDNNGTCYEVQKRPSGGEWRIIEKCLSPNSKSYTAKDLMTGKNYTFKVKAKNSYGHSAWSNHADIITCALKNPTNTKYSKSTKVLSYNDPNTCESGYWIEIRDSATKKTSFVWVASALPASALPASIRLSNALPASALPASALPAQVIPGYALPASALPASFKFQTTGVTTSLPTGVSLSGASVQITP